MSLDYIIVGSGLSGLMLCEQLRARGKSFVVVSNTSQQASIVASGLYNPVVLKRFNMAWNADQQLPPALSAYKKIESLLGIKIDDQRPIYRIFNSIEEQNNWFLACDKPKLQQFLVPKILDNNNPSIQAPFGCGEVKFTLPLEGTKGELLVVHAPDLKCDVILKAAVFIIPIGNDNYLVGSTYAWNDYSNTPTESAKNELLEKLKKLILCPFKVVQQRAGIRPTVADRRPLVGQHETHKNLYVMNGLGSRGVLIAPSIAKDLIAHIEDDITLPKEIDINRFKS